MTTAIESVSRVPGDIVKYRWIWFALVGVCLAVSFNGQWQVGPDSAAYRALGHQLATTGHYFFRDKVPGVPDYLDQQGTRYPGLPCLLAGIEKLFGPGAVAPLICMTLIAVLTLALTYRLMLYRFDRWLAVSVVVGMGTNPRFLQYANGLLSDMPFLLGVVLTLLGFERLLRTPQPGRFAKPIALLAVGLVLAAIMRPTFWILAAALAVACVWGLIMRREGLCRGPEAPFGPLPEKTTMTAVSKAPAPVGVIHYQSQRATGVAALAPAAPAPQAMLLSRLRFVWPLLIMLGASALFLIVLDVRAKHGLGGYEQRTAELLADFRQKTLPNLPNNLAEMLEKALPTAFLGCRVSDRHMILFTLGDHTIGAGSVISLLVLVAGAALMRRNVLWGVLILFTAGALLIGGSVPRYFLMVLPLLLAGWGAMLGAGASCCRRRWVADLIMRGGLALIFCFNIAVTCDFVRIQHGLTAPIVTDEAAEVGGVRVAGKSTRHWRGLHHEGFLNIYHGGQWAHVYDLAATINATTPADQKLIGPEATVLTYLSGRQVYPPSVAQAQGVKLRQFPKALAHVGPGRGVFREYDEAMARVMDYGSIVLGEPVSRVAAGYQIFRIKVVPPPPRPERPERRERRPRRPHGVDDDEPTTGPSTPGRDGPASRDDGADSGLAK